jgi:DNA-directed RNA polymerase
MHLKIPSKKLNGNKQIRALMPNLIHSLDATALALLVETYFNNIAEVQNFYSIHDCFAVTANNVNNMIQFLKLAYIKIYTEDAYLRKLDRGILDYIKFSYGEDCFDPDTNKITVTITVDDKSKTIVEDYPNINLALGTKLPQVEDLIKNSSYLAS